MDHKKEPIEDLESIPKHISVFKILDDIKWNIPVSETLVRWLLQHLGCAP